MKQKVNIYDIAAMAGVSPSTVSNVLNGREDKVSPSTRERVLSCLEITGYKTNQVARNLVTGRSMLIGVCLPVLEAGATQSDLLENNPFFHEFIDGVQRVMLENGYECIVRGLDDNLKYIDWVQNRCLDGLIDLGNLSDSVYSQLGSLNVPVVLVDNYNRGNENYDVVVTDDVNGGYAATKHLLELGHTKIGFVHNNIMSAGVDAERFAGYRKALEEYGVKQTYTYNTVLDYPHGIEFGHRIADESLPVTAVLCTADITAIGIVYGLEERGKRVPEDYSVVGYDDIKTLQYVRPSLTTVRQDIFGKGCLCARILLDKLKNPQTHVCKKTVLDTKLVVRRSTGRLR